MGMEVLLSFCFSPPKWAPFVCDPTKCQKRLPVVLSLLPGEAEFFCFSSRRLPVFGFQLRGCVDQWCVVPWTPTLHNHVSHDRFLFFSSPLLSSLMSQHFHRRSNIQQNKNSDNAIMYLDVLMQFISACENVSQCCSSWPNVYITKSNSHLSWFILSICVV